MRRAIATGCAAAVLLAGATWAVASSRSATSARLTPPATAIIRATHFYGKGPSAVYAFDSGSISGVSALRLTFPAGATYDAVVTVSMGYRTSAKDEFIVGLVTRRDSEYGQQVPVSPSARAIRASEVETSATAVFRLSDLQGDVEYWFSPTVNLHHRVGDRASVRSNDVLLVVDATPSQ